MWDVSVVRIDFTIIANGPLSVQGAGCRRVVNVADWVCVTHSKHSRIQYTCAYSLRIAFPPMKRLVAFVGRSQHQEAGTYIFTHFLCSQKKMPLTSNPPLCPLNLAILRISQPVIVAFLSMVAEATSINRNKSIQFLIVSHHMQLTNNLLHGIK